MQDPSVEQKSQGPRAGSSAQPTTGSNPTAPVQERTPSMPAVRSNRPAGGLRTGVILILALVLLLVLGVGIFAGWQFGKSSSSGTSSTTQSGLTAASLNAIPQAVAGTFRQSVVRIDIVTQQAGGLGSGTIIDNRGYIVTNYHVIEGAKEIRVELYDGLQLPAQLTGIDPPDDLAVIKITPPSHMAVAKIGDSSQLKVAEYVMALGNPLGITQTVTAGIVSALGRNVPAGPGVDIIGAIQTDAAINPGNSGGALVDLQGELIGVPTLTILNPTFNSPASGVGFAIPSNLVKFIVPQIIETGRVIHTGRASLGVNAVTVDATVAAQYNLSVDRGALIVSTTTASSATSAGLRAGDVIVKIDNTTVTGVPSLREALFSKSPGDTVAVTFYRGSQQMTVQATLGEQPASSSSSTSI